MTARDRAWDKIDKDIGIANHDFSKSLLTITATQIKKVAKSLFLME